MFRKKKNDVTFMNRLEIIMMSILSSLKYSAADYCDFETTDGHRNIVLNNGALLTIIKYDGTKSIVGLETFTDYIENLTSKLSVFLNKKGHQLGMVFSKDLNVTSELYELSRIKKETAKRLELDVGFIIDADEETYRSHVYEEKNYIFLVSFPSLLDSSEVALESKRHAERYKNVELPSFSDSQDILQVNSYLRSQHDSYVESFMNAITDTPFSSKAEVLSAEEALHAVKKSVSPMTTDEKWRPLTPESKVKNIPIRLKNNHFRYDPSNVLWSPLPEQIMRCNIIGADKSSTGTYPVGSVITDCRIYTPLLVSSPPKETVYFNELFTMLNNNSTKVDMGGGNYIERSLPYSISFVLQGDGFSGHATKKALAKILAVANSDNRNIKSALDSIEYRATKHKETMVLLSMSCMTWAENNAFGIDEIQIRRSKLWRTIEAWGGAQVVEKGGDPILGFVSNMPCLSYKHHAPKFVAPLRDSLTMMPWTRQASPFTNGSILNRTTDGKLLKLEAFSGEQKTWVKAYVGKPGSGKSVAMNNDIFETCLLAGLTRLPFIFMIDVGYSSRGFVNLIRDHLPPEKKYLAVYKRLKNDERSAINPLECLVGRMIPEASEIETMVSFLSTLITPEESKGEAEKGMSGFLSLLIKKTFLSKMEGDESGNPNKYEYGRTPEIDQLVDKLNIDTFGLSYFKLVEKFHKLKEYRARDLAHRLAMPILADTIFVVTNDQEIQKTYGNSITDMGGSLIDVYLRSVTEAETMYPIFCHTTAFDVDTARVVSLDLQDVIGNNQKQTSLFFQIAKIFAKKRTAISEDDVEKFPPMYQDYYRRLVKNIIEDKKILAFDEMHNVKNDPNLFNSIIKDCREARKWNMEIKLASQELTDFHLIQSFITSYVIADRGSPADIEYMKKTMNLNKESCQAIATHVKLNGSGLTYFSLIRAKTVEYSSLMTLTLCPLKIWAFSTDPDDNFIRNAMFELVGDRPKALMMLSKAYPFGVKKEMSRRRELMMNNNQMGAEDIGDDENSSIAAVMSKEIYQAFRG